MKAQTAERWKVLNGKNKRQKGRKKVGGQKKKERKNVKDALTLNIRHKRNNWTRKIVTQHWLLREQCSHLEEEGHRSQVV